MTLFGVPFALPIPSAESRTQSLDELDAGGGAPDAFDIEPFTLALFDPTGYAAQYPHCGRMRADINTDGNVDAFDIEPFIAMLFGP